MKQNTGLNGMSEDIVERLKWSGQDAMTKHYSLGMAGLHADAIAEILRLRSLLSETVEALEHVLATSYVDQNTGGMGLTDDFDLAKIEAAIAKARGEK